MRCNKMHILRIPCHLKELPKMIRTSALFLYTVFEDPYPEAWRDLTTSAITQPQLFGVVHWEFMIQNVLAHISSTALIRYQEL
jgi:hypothetical protein